MLPATFDEMFTMLQTRIARLERRCGGIVLPAVVAEADADGNKVQCDLAAEGEPPMLTGFVPVVQTRAAAALKIFAPVDVGERGLIIAPNGLTDSGYFFPGLFSTGTPPPVAAGERGDKLRIVAGDVVIEIDRAGDAVSVTAPSAVTVTAANITLTGAVRVNGGVSVRDDVVTDANISLNGHHHDYTRPAHSAGTADTTPSQP